MGATPTHAGSASCPGVMRRVAPRSERHAAVYIHAGHADRHCARGAQQMKRVGLSPPRFRHLRQLIDEYAMYENDGHGCQLALRIGPVEVQGWCKSPLDRVILPGAGAVSARVVAASVRSVWQCQRRRCGAGFPWQVAPYPALRGGSTR